MNTQTRVNDLPQVRVTVVVFHFSGKLLLTIGRRAKREGGTLSSM